MPVPDSACSLTARQQAVITRLCAAWAQHAGARPLLAVQSTYSLLEGTIALPTWAALLQAWHNSDQDDPTPPHSPLSDRRGGNHPAGPGAVIQARAALLPHTPVDTPPPTSTRYQTTASTALTSQIPPVWAALTDRDDLLSLPSAYEHWGTGRVGLGTLIHEHDHDVVVLAPDARSYRALCHWLSARHEGTSHQNMLLDGLIICVRDEALGHAYHQRGAEVWWRADRWPETAPRPFPIACIPIVRHLDTDDHEHACILAAIQRRQTVPSVDPQLFPLSDIADIPAHYRGYEQQLHNSAALRQRLGWQPCMLPHMPPLPPDYRSHDADTLLATITHEHLPTRYGDATRAAAQQRLTHELTIIRAKGFASYIISVWSLARHRRTCGRGSAASSIVCYILGITNVDPVRYHLVFERFLAPERTDPPDIDIDFPWDERDDVLRHTFATFGHDHVAMVATHQSLRPDGALREASLAFGYDGRLPDHSMRATIERAAHLITDNFRHLGLHCGGVIITTQPIRDLVPIHRASKSLTLNEHAPLESTSPLASGLPTIAWEKDGAEACGLIKIDLLGNRSLAVIRDVLADLHHDGIDIQESRWDPVHDPATRTLVAEGRTMGCFYIESPATRQLQAKIGSGDFDRLIIHSSIIRPAGSSFIDTYIERHHRWLLANGQPSEEELATWYPHPCLRSLLSDSYGVLSYQEDVMLVAQQLAGFGSREANMLRKALGRSDTTQRLQVLANDFANGCRQRDVSDTVITSVWNMISSFAGYSFCKAHSASYALVSFQCAWLKAHYPAYFLARVIANEGGFYSACAYVEEARRLGIAILGPCAHASTWLTQREGPGSIRIGFHRILSLTRRCADDLIRHRPFHSVSDLWQRCTCSSSDLEALHESGALDALLPTYHAAQRAWIVQQILHQPAPRRAQQQNTPHTQSELYFTPSAPTPAAKPDPVPPDLPTVSQGHIWGYYFRRLRLLPQAHPLCLWRIHQRPLLRVRDLTAALRGSTITIAAWCITRKTVNATYTTDEHGRALPQPNHRDMAFVTLEDETGLLETIWFPDCWAEHHQLLHRAGPLHLTGKVTVAYGVLSIDVRDVWPADHPTPPRRHGRTGQRYSRPHEHTR